MKKTNISKNVTYNELQQLYNAGIISEPEFLKGIMRINQLDKIKKQYNDFKIRKDDGRLYITIDRQSYYGRTKEEVWEKIRDKLYVDMTKTLTFEDIFPDYMQYKKKHKIDSKTLQESVSVWNNYIKSAKITKKPIVSLSAKDFQHYFEDITDGLVCSSHNFQNIKGLLNGIMAYAINELEITNSNPIINCSTKSIKFKPRNPHKKTFTIADGDKLLSYLANNDENDLYALAIELDFHMVLRIGELLAININNIDYEKGSILICEQLRYSRKMNKDLTFSKREYEIVPFLKGKTNYGYRNIPLTEEAKRIIEKIREINPDSDYLFCYNNKFLVKDTVNERLKKYCLKAGIKPHSSHGIRFYTASKLYQAGCPIPYIQKLLGHSNIETTLNYLKNIIDEKECFEQARKALS